MDKLGALSSFMMAPDLMSLNRSGARPVCSASLARITPNGVDAGSSGNWMRILRTDMKKGMRRDDQNVPKVLTFPCPI